MKLIDVIVDIDNIDKDAIIYQEDLNDYDSDIILSYANAYDQGIKKEGGREYHYLLEVFLAKEFIDDWVGSLSFVPTTKEISKRLHDYAVNDA